MDCVGDRGTWVGRGDQMNTGGTVGRERGTGTQRDRGVQTLRQVDTGRAGSRETVGAGRYASGGRAGWEEGGAPRTGVDHWKGKLAARAAAVPSADFPSALIFLFYTVSSA